MQRGAQPVSCGFLGHRRPGSGALGSQVTRLASRPKISPKAQARSPDKGEAAP